MHSKKIQIGSINRAPKTKPKTEKREKSSDQLPNTVFMGFIATWFLAASPINLSVSVKATYDGVVLFPWSLAMISTRSCCHTPTHE